MNKSDQMFDSLVALAVQHESDLVVRIDILASALRFASEQLADLEDLKYLRERNADLTRSLSELQADYAKLFAKKDSSIIVDRALDYVPDNPVLLEIFWPEINSRLFEEYRNGDLISVIRLVRHELDCNLVLAKKLAQSRIKVWKEQAWDEAHEVSPL